MSEMLKSPTLNPKKMWCFFCEWFLMLHFIQKIFPQIWHRQSYLYDYSCEKKQLRHSNAKCVENISRRYKNHKTCAKTTLTFFWFLFRDFNISNIFYKIQNVNEWPLVLIITHWTYTFLNPWIRKADSNSGQKH